MNQKTSNQNRSAGFTLIELLLVIAIMAVLSTMSLALMRSATEDAKAAATATRISKIESMLQMQMEDYEVRRLPISRRDLASAVTGTNKLVKMQNLRSRILVDIINAEMPRPFQKADGSYTAVSNGNGTNEAHAVAIGQYPTDINKPSSQKFAAALSAKLTAATPASVNRWNSIKGRTSPQGIAYSAAGGFDLPAEYLYEILLTLDFDGIGGLEGLGAGSIGDSDGDGILEIVDAWGEPMDFEIQQLDATYNLMMGVYSDDVSFVSLDTAIPRSLEKIRFVVRSSKMPYEDLTK
jgi:prepilin-type N-terminal cleavage/methylation domain-containing protein